MCSLDFPIFSSVIDLFSLSCRLRKHFFQFIDRIFIAGIAEMTIYLDWLSIINHGLNLLFSNTDHSPFYPFL